MIHVVPFIGSRPRTNDHHYPWWGGKAWAKESIVEKTKCPYEHKEEEGYFNLLWSMRDVHEWG